jgi:hypothetical protein
LFRELIDFLGSTGWSAALLTSQEAAKKQKTERSSNEDGFHADPPWSRVYDHTTGR